MSHRRLACLLVVPLVLAAGPIKKRPHPARTPAPQARESREDLERRVEQLEQKYELKEPALPPLEPDTRQP